MESNEMNNQDLRSSIKATIKWDKNFTPSAYEMLINKLTNFITQDIPQNVLNSFLDIHNPFPEQLLNSFAYSARETYKNIIINTYNLPGATKSKYFNAIKDFGIYNDQMEYNTNFKENATGYLVILNNGTSFIIGQVYNMHKNEFANPKEIIHCIPP
uniref:Uncharacterized protein n=1 Tax=Ranid herpesvirus 4 TaxID=2849006 RepID=A0A8F3HSZ4_9VIRU|nr:MAG: hypothetical protein [Ranid herpesvirus 4]